MSALRHSSLSWVVATTHYKRETWAAENAVNQGFEIYLPKILQRRRGKRRPSYLIAIPVFPGYLFVRWRHNWHTLLNTFGVSSVLLQGESPHVIHDRVLRQLRSRENDKGFIDLPKPQPGVRVAIKRGAFRGQVGLYAGMQAADRKRVLLDILGRKTEVIVGADAVEMVPAA